MTTTTYSTRPSTRSKTKTKPGKEVQYRGINAVVNDWWVVVGDRQFPVAALTGAYRVENVVIQPPDMKKVKQNVLRSLGGLSILLFIVVVIEHGGNLSYAFGWVAWWVMYTIFQITSYSRPKTERTYTLMLVTDSQPEPLPVASSPQGVYINIVADDINKRIARQRLTLPPPERAEWRRNDTGAPTRRLTTRT